MTAGTVVHTRLVPFMLRQAQHERQEARRGRGGLSANGTRLSANGNGSAWRHAQDTFATCVTVGSNSGSAGLQPATLVGSILSRNRSSPGHAKSTRRAADLAPVSCTLAGDDPVLRQCDTAAVNPRHCCTRGNSSRKNIPAAGGRRLQTCATGERAARGVSHVLRRKGLKRRGRD